MRVALTIAAILILHSFDALAQRRPDPARETFFYTDGGLRLQAYLYKPRGAGPFPMVVYNHGSRRGDERVEYPLAYIARIFVPRGYVVLVPERRGYGKSEGVTLSQELGEDRGRRFVARVRLETNDVLAATNYVLKTRNFVDPHRVAIMGFSFGGMVTAFAAAANPRFAAAIVQAPGAGNWDRSADLRDALVAAAERIRVPTFCAVAENDQTTESTRAICEGVHANGTPAELKIYPSFTSRQRRSGAPGHALFTPDGVSVWTKDVLDFLVRTLPPPAKR